VLSLGVVNFRVHYNNTLKLYSVRVYNVTLSQLVEPISLLTLSDNFNVTLNFVHIYSIEIVKKKLIYIVHVTHKKFHRKKILTR
jgi:hypothetical protein